MTYGTSNAIEPNSADNSALQTRLSCLLEGLSPIQRDHLRTQSLSQLNLLGSESVPIFDEVTQTVSRLLAMPICILSVIDAEMQRFKSVVGLSSLGLMNQLAAARSIPRVESFCTHVIDSGKTFALEDATAHPAFSRSLLVQQYGIHSYLGVPLITTEGTCIGTLAVMDLLPHRFTQQEIAFLEISARWSMSEFEKQAIAVNQNNISQQLTASQSSQDSLRSKISQVRFDLIVQLTQDLRNPLTSITGMANMLSREIYGPLSEKQQEYAKIVLSSSQQLLGMVDEIVEVGDLKEDNYQLSLARVDIEMVGQQALSALENLANQQELKLKLTVEPGSRIWTLDKRIIKQLIYHLVFSLIKMSTAGSTIRLHVSRKDDSISLVLWVSNPWLGEDLPQAVIAWEQNTQADNLTQSSLANFVSTPSPSIEFSSSDMQGDSQNVFEALATAQKVDASRQELGLLLSRHLTKMHSGEVAVQGSAATGYRYIITLPALKLPG
jgi:signal transduction histidine kinase